MRKEFAKKVYVSETVCSNCRGRWKDRVKKYMCERGASRGGERLEQARKECLDRDGWGLFCCGHLCGRMSLEGVRCQSYG